MKNYLAQAFFLLMLTLVLVVAANRVLERTNGGGFALFYSWKPVDLLADIRPDYEEPDSVIADVPSLDTVRLASGPTSTCPAGLTCLRDYSAAHEGLQHFFSALGRAKKKVVRIGFFGDSFIEGDIFTAHVRDTLQQLFGGKGIGYMPLATEVAHFRTTIRHEYSHWAVGTVVQNPDTLPLAFPGYGFRPRPGNRILWQSPGKQASSALSTLHLYYQSARPVPMSGLANDTLAFRDTLAPALSLHRYQFPFRDLKKIDLTFDCADSCFFAGASFESGTGILVDNLGLRGNSGMGFAYLTDAAIQQFQQLHPYDLIVLQYGLNVISEKDSISYKAYAQRMVRQLERLKRLLPETSFLLMSISDRSQNHQGTLRTSPAVLAMRQSQQWIATEAGIVYWDLFEAMGGKNSMITWVERDPPLAAKDYTHLTFRGGKRLARSFVKALLHEKTEYEKNRL